MEAIKGTINSILVIRRNNIGDMICALPVLKTLRKEFPRARLTVLAESTNSLILKNADYIDDVIVFKRGRGLFRNKYLNFWRLFRQKKAQFDLAIVLKAGFSSTSALATLLSRARYRMGCLPDKWHPLQLCYNMPLKVQEQWHPNHIIDIFLEMIRPLGTSSPVRDISFDIPEEPKERMRSFLEKTGARAKDGIVVFNISNNRPDTLWPLERFKETADLILRRYNAAIIITSMPADREKALQLSEGKADVFYFDEKSKIMDFAALADVSDLIICGEGGAMHIGASVGTPTISLWGGTASVSNWMHRKDNQFMVNKGDHVRNIMPEDIMEIVRENNLLK